MDTATIKKGLVFPTLGELNEAVSNEYAAAHRQAKVIAGRECPFVRSRGRDLIAANDQGRLAVDPLYGWNGTMKELLEYVAYTSDDGITELWIDGGFDCAASLQGFDGGDYEPIIETWEVLAWRTPYTAYHVQVGVVVDTLTGRFEERGLIVHAPNSTHAGVIARQRVAKNRGETYSPDVHKVISVREEPVDAADDADRYERASLNKPE